MHNDLIAELDALIAAHATNRRTAEWQEWEIEIMRRYRMLPSSVLAIKLDRSLSSVEGKRRRLAVDWARQEKRP